MAEPRKGNPYIFFLPLLDSGTGEFLLNPTISSGDFRVSQDGGNFLSLTTTPQVLPSASGSVQVSLNASEMNGDKIVVEGIDITTVKEWRSVFTFIDPVGTGLQNVKLDGFTLARDNTKGLRRSSGNRRTIGR